MDFSFAPPGSVWLALAPAGSSWPLLVPPGSWHWLLLVPPGFSWLLCGSQQGAGGGQGSQSSQEEPGKLEEPWELSWISYWLYNRYYCMRECFHPHATRRVRCFKLEEKTAILLQLYFKSEATYTSNELPVVTSSAGLLSNLLHFKCLAYRRICCTRSSRIT